MSVLGRNFATARDTLLRMFPHATPTGLRRIGSPDCDSPVLLTGNFSLTVRRLTDRLAGYDAWLLVANSGGVNVWCAAGGGHLTDHDVVAVIRSSGIEQRVNHRTLVLPQLAATGIERREIAERTGWKTRWGPAHLDDLPEFLDRGLHVRNAQRAVRFSLRSRLEMAVVWTVPMTLVATVVVALILGLTMGVLAGGMIAAAVCGIFAGLPAFAVVGPRRLVT
jgi:hypothetical protein